MESVYIGPPTLPNDIPLINNVFYQAFLGAHVNEEIGITTEDIKTFFKDRTKEDKTDDYARHLSNLPPNEHFIVAKDRDMVVGVCRLIVRDAYNQLQAIYVLPEYQRQGLGSKLWSEAQKFFDPTKDIVVHVATYNINAIHFYQNLGFVDTGRRFTEERHRMPISNVLIPEMEMILKRQQRN